MFKSNLAILAAMTASLAASCACADGIKTALSEASTVPTAADRQEFVQTVGWGIEERNATGALAGYALGSGNAEQKEAFAVNIANATEGFIGTDLLALILFGYASLSLSEGERPAQAEISNIAAFSPPYSEWLKSQSQSIEDCRCRHSSTSSLKSYEKGEKSAVFARLSGLNQDVAISLGDPEIAQKDQEIFETYVGAAA